MPNAMIQSLLDRKQQEIAAVPQQRMNTAPLVEALVGALPGAGDAMAARDSVQEGQQMAQAFRQGDVGGGITHALYAALNAAGALPMVPALGGIIKAFHGSPHSFDKFDMSKIGTGEGAQAYGHGLYFAENPEVARDYQKNVLDMDFIRKTNDRLKEIARELGQYEVPGAYGKYKDPRGYELKAEYDDLMDKKLNKPGQFYNVDLDVDPEDLLDWDAPLSEQPQKVRTALGPYIDQLRQQDPGALAVKMWDKGQGTGEVFYRTLAADLGLNVEGNVTPMASQALRNAGIPGLRYFDGMSRNKGEGSRNVVMFDDDKIAITGRE